MNKLAKYIIDSHAHIFPQKIAEKATINIGKFYDIVMDLNGSVDMLLAQAEKVGVTKSVVHSVATVPQQVCSINDFIHSQVELHPDKFIGFASLHPDMEGLSEEVDRIISMGLKGIKLHPDFQSFAIDEDRACRMYEIVDGRLPFLFHTGDYRYKYSNPDIMGRVADMFPDTRFIAAHFGGWSEWDKAAECLPGKKNVWVDCSSSFFQLTPERARELVYLFGVDRVFFGTDYPMWTAKGELDFLKSMNLPCEDMEKILWKNINDFLSLGLE